MGGIVRKHSILLLINDLAKSGNINIHTPNNEMPIPEKTMTKKFDCIIIYCLFKHFINFISIYETEPIQVDPWVLAFYRKKCHP